MVVAWDCPELWRCVPVKKTTILLVSLLLYLPLFASADYPSGWYSLSSGDDVVVSRFFLPDGCSVSLPDSMSISPLATVRPFTAAPGVYSVPSDVPPGQYSVRCADTSSWCIVSVWNDAGKLVLSQVMHLDEGGLIASVPLSNNYSIKVEHGSARFDAAIGVTFD